MSQGAGFEAAQTAGVGENGAASPLHAALAPRAARWLAGVEHGTPRCRDARGATPAGLARQRGHAALGGAIDRALAAAPAAACAAAAAFASATAASGEDAASSSAKAAAEAAAGAAAAAVRASFASLLRGEWTLADAEPAFGGGLGGRNGPTSLSAGAKALARPVDEDGDNEFDAVWAEDPDYAYAWPSDE